MNRLILHIDMDAFYASVEQHDQPAYRGKPVVVGADPQRGRGRGVVSAASYEARAFGIHSAMPISQAFRRCPQGVFLPVRMARYQEVSAQIFAIFHRYTELVEPLSLDEAFLDVTGSLRLFGSAEMIGQRIQNEIYQEEGLGASVGLATTKFVAKVASDLQKPNGFVFVSPKQETRFLQDLPVERLWGVGPKTAKQLRRLGYTSIGTIAQDSQARLVDLFGKAGAHLWQLAQGIDPRPVIPEEPAQSIGAESTFDKDTNDSRVIQQTLLWLAERVSQRLRAEVVLAGTVTLKWRDETFRTVTRACPLTEVTDEASILYKRACMLLQSMPNSNLKVRLLGLTTSKLSSRKTQGQLSLFETSDTSHIQQAHLTEALEVIRRRFGDTAIQRASLLSSNNRRSMT